MASAALIASLGACFAVTVMLPFCAGHRYCTVVVSGVSLAAVLGPLVVRPRGIVVAYRRMRRLALLLALAWSCANVSLAVIADAAGSTRRRHRAAAVTVPQNASVAEASSSDQWAIDAHRIPVIAGRVMAARASEIVSPVPGAIVRLYTEDRSIVIASAVSGPDGTFVLEITVPQPGNSYVLTIAHAQFRTYASMLQALPGFRYEHDVYLNPRDPVTH
jgi:hypothetical protein